jgi:hypothetical protein
MVMTGRTMMVLAGIGKGSVPEVIGLPKGTKFEVENTLGSGDRADVYFSIEDKFVVAEIKSKFRLRTIYAKVCFNASSTGR